MINAGLDPIKNAKEFQAFADVINAGTGRGKFGEPFTKAINAFGGGRMGADKVKASARGIERLASIGIFSPKLLASRMSFINPKNYMTKYVGKPAAVEKWRQLIATASFGVALAGAVKLAKHNGADMDIETDARSSDFMKVKMGNTRIDLTGGEAAYARLVGQLVTGQSKNLRTGKIKEIGKDYGSGTKLDLIGRFARSKASPVVGSSMNIVAGKNVVGEPSYLSKEVIESFMPLYIMDVEQALVDEGYSPTLAPAIVSGFFGSGLSTYGSRKEEIKKKKRIKTQQQSTRKSIFSSEGVGDRLWYQITGKKR